jgi:hypothetical protein
MPRLPKPDERRQSRRQPAALALLPQTNQPPPDPDPAWTQTVQNAWHTAWADPISAGWQPSDQPALRRLFDLRDLVEHLDMIIGAEPIVEGSKGQQRPNPVAGMADRIRAEIRQLEDRFGLNPKAKIQLGATSHAVSERSLHHLAVPATAQATAPRDPRV